ncbi:MAG TPA: peptide deformylase [Candidatus Nanoarchaeia archaeon]|nr:peptide deformylase [Candidatus Nanoarchaeia archaeon]
MTKILKILTLPAESLRKKSEAIGEDRITAKEFEELCDDLAETMVQKEGIGLAAPQIGRNVRLIVVNTKKGPIMLFNPKIVKKSWLKEWGEEGCLSVPLIFGDVKRHKKITCVFCNRQGAKNRIKASGMLARVIQHEIDHLDGILFVDKAKNLKKIDEEEKEI